MIQVFNYLDGGAALFGVLLLLPVDLSKGVDVLGAKIGSMLFESVSSEPFMSA